MGKQQPQKICSDESGFLLSDSPPPLLSAGGMPMLVSYNAEQEDAPHIFSSQLVPKSPAIQHHRYYSRIPHLRGTKMRGCCHGWVFLSKPPNTWNLWNPETLKLITLPPLSFKEGKDTDGGDDIVACCLSAPPSHPDAVVLLTRKNKPIILFCLLTNNTNTQWTEISYSQHLKNEDDVIAHLVCVNGKVYAATSHQAVLQVDINYVLVPHHNSSSSNPGIRQVHLSFLSLAGQPYCCGHYYAAYLTGYCKELFTILACFKFKDCNGKNLISLRLFKLSLSTMMWEEMRSAKDHVFFVVIGKDDYTTISCPGTMEYGSGNYVHMIDKSKLYSYNMEKKTMTLYSIPCPDLTPELWPNYSTVWVMPESRLQGDSGKAKSRNNTIKEEPSKDMVVRSAGFNGDDVDNMMIKLQLGERMKVTNSYLLDMPFHILEVIVKNVTGLDYLSFRATCKHCRLAAPPIQWSTPVALERLQTQSTIILPWVMVLHIDQGIFTFIDPRFGDKYYMTTFLELSDDAVVYTSKFGWVLIHTTTIGLVFFNPFTKSIIQLPEMGQRYHHIFSSFSFSAPPTSPDCDVVGFAPAHGHVCIISPGWESQWTIIDLDCNDFQYQTSPHRSLTFFQGNIYTLCADGELRFVRIDEEEEYGWKILIARSPETFSGITTTVGGVDRYLVECNNDLLSVVVDELGEWVQIFKLDRQTQAQWERVDCLGNYMIFCGSESFSSLAKFPGMKNKIFFPRFFGQNIVFYSLDTCKFHAFVDNCILEEEETLDFHFTEEQLMCVWIEPSWTS